MRTRTASPDLYYTTNPRAMGDCQLIVALVSVAYDSGYYSGKREDGQPHHVRAVNRRNALQREALTRLGAISKGGQNAGE